MSVISLAAGASHQEGAPTTLEGSLIMSIDWEAIARHVGALNPSGESGGDHLAKAALADLLGEDELRRAVHHYVRRDPGAELVRSVLWLLRPRTAARECYRIFRGSPHLEERRAAVELLRVVGDAAALPWVEELLDDPDPEIQSWGAGLVDQLVWAELVDDDDIEPWIVRAEAHENEQVRRVAAFVREVQARREAGEAGDGSPADGSP